jgi:Zn-dependent M28 family amino/carboxypeptidase
VIAGVVAVVTQPFVRPVASDPPPIDTARLEVHVKHLSADLHPRSYDQLRNTERTAQYIFDQLKASGAAVGSQDVIAGKTTYRNIVARFGPASGPLIVVGAHYDAHVGTPGADDNASGVAGLIELAGLLGRNPPHRSIELVAYALEEPPFFRTDSMGSAWHARALRSANREVQLMLSLEMIGYFSDTPASQLYPFPGMSHLYSDRGDFIALVAKMRGFGVMRRVKALMTGATRLPVYSINAPALLVAGIDFSDQLNYWNAGYPALMITDTAFLRNPNYHGAGDTYEKLDYRRMAQVVQAVFVVTQQY